MALFNVPFALAIGILATVTGLWVMAVAGDNMDEDLAVKGAVIAVGSTFWCGYYLVFSI